MSTPVHHVHMSTPALEISSSVPFFQRRQWHPTPVLLPGKSNGRRSLVGCSPCGHEESDTTGRLHFDFSLSHIGEGNGNPLHCSCLENPRDWGAWWSSVCGVAQSRTRLKRLSSSSSLLIPNSQFIRPSHPFPLLVTVSLFTLSAKHNLKNTKAKC